MEKITNEEKAKAIADFLSIDIETLHRKSCYLGAIEMAKRKDEQHKQELIRIYNFVSPYLTPEAINDLKIIIGLC